MRVIILITTSILLIFMGCINNSVQPDVTPPSIPRGLYAYAGDNFVELSWDQNPESDLAGYNIYVCNSYDGKYRIIKSTSETFYIDYNTANGQTYYYRISAYDRSGNESYLSRQTVFATPRPEGHNVKLWDYHSSPNYSGYDFSTNTIGPYNDQYTDIFFEYYENIFYLDVWDDTEIQDMGYTNSLDEIFCSPTTGWSPTKDVRLIVGHTYVIRTWDKHYAKVRVLSLTNTYLIFEWAYQLQVDNPYLKSYSVERDTLAFGIGAMSRIL